MPLRLKPVSMENLLFMVCLPELRSLVFFCLTSLKDPNVFKGLFLRKRALFWCRLCNNQIVVLRSQKIGLVLTYLLNRCVSYRPSLLTSMGTGLASVPPDVKSSLVL